MLCLRHRPLVPNLQAKTIQRLLAHKATRLRILISSILVLPTPILSITRLPPALSIPEPEIFIPITAEAATTDADGPEVGGAVVVGLVDDAVD